MFRLRRFAFLWIGVTILTGGAGQAARAQNATISLKAKEVNGVPVGMTSYVVINPGDVIKAEIRISGWAPALLQGYVVTVSWDSFTSSCCGGLFPVGWDNPHPELGCNSDIDCPEGLICWRPDGNTPTYCTGPNHDPTQGLYLDPDEWVNVCWRPDYVFAVSPGEPCVDFRAVDCIPLDCRIRAMLWDPSDAREDDGTDKYLGTLELQASPDAGGVFTISMIPGNGNTSLQDVRGLNIPATIENLTVEIADRVCDCPTCGPIQSYPVHCAIDAGQDREPGAVGLQGPRSMVLELAPGFCDPSYLSPDDFSVSEFPGGGANSIVSVVPGPGYNELTLNFLRRISLRTWTCVDYLPAVPPGTQTRYCIGFLPGDVNNDGISQADDVLAMIDCLSTPETCAAYQCDVDRSGTCGATDILRTIDLLNGGSTLAEWRGQGMDAACPTGR